MERATVVAHLIHCEDEDWMPRAKMILQSGEAQAFAPLDREGHVRFGQGKTLSQLLDEFAQLRARKPGRPARAASVGGGSEAAWAASGVGCGDAVGVAGDVGSARSDTLHQISRIMAHQYREAAGPWARYLGVMQCAAHGAAG